MGRGTNINPLDEKKETCKSEFTKDAHSPLYHISVYQLDISEL